MKSSIWRCGLKTSDFFEKVCPLEWESLEKSLNPSIRNCKTCNREVHLCSMPDEFIKFTEKGFCIAIPSQFDLEGKETGSILGQPLPWSYQLEANALKWWKEISRNSNKDIDRQIHKDIKKNAIRRSSKDLKE